MKAEGQALSNSADPPNKRYRLNLKKKIQLPGLQGNHTHSMTSCRNRIKVKDQEICLILGSTKNSPRQHDDTVTDRSESEEKIKNRESQGSNGRLRQQKKIEVKKRMLERASTRNLLSKRKRRQLRQSYIQKLENIRVESRMLKDSSVGLLSQANLAESLVRRRYTKLRESSQEILTGIQGYQLEQQKLKIYKLDVRNMWMRTDR